MPTRACPPREQQLLSETLRRIAADLSMIADRKLEIFSVHSEIASERAAGTKQIHISFKLGLQHEGRIGHGVWLVPLPDALALAGYLMMVPEEGVKSKRALTAPDPLSKEALLEIGQFVASAVDAALRSGGVEGVRVKSESCQGVRANVRPAFAHEPGSELWIARAKAQLGSWPAFEVILMLPVLALEAQASVSNAASA